MDLDGRAWIAQLPAELDGQRAILDELLKLCAADDRIAWLVIGCSLARGAADRLSDLDLAMGVRDEEFPAILAEVRTGVERLGVLVDRFHHQLPGVTGTHERIFAQYANRCQVDLVVLPASQSVASSVVLYDPEGRFAASAQRPPVTPEQIREWAFLGWCALADLGKYLRRRSAWEALNRLTEARGYLWQLWALAHDVADPQYGLTSILDFAAGQLPTGLEATVADLDLARLLSAGQSLAALLSEAGHQLPPDQQAVLPEAMARFVTADLAELASASMSGRPCRHRQAYLEVMGLWGPAAPAATAIDSDGKLAPGAGGTDRESAFRGWYLITRGDEHPDPCGPPAR